jgi:hypothetical protein
MFVGLIHTLDNTIPKNVTLACMEEGEQFRLLDRNGKATGGRYTVIDTNPGVCTAYDPNGNIVDLMHVKHRHVKPVQVVALTVAAKLKHYK